MSSTPIVDRTELEIRKALEDQAPEVGNTFVQLWKYACAPENRLGYAQLSQRTGLSPSILSQGFSGTYKGDFLAISERISKFFWRLEQQQKYGGIRQFVPTVLTRYLFDVFEKTRVIRRMQLIESPEQVGKTRVAVEYTHQNNSGRTVYVQLSGGSTDGLGDFIANLASQLNIATTIQVREKKARIRESMEACDLIIIDEVHLVWTWTDKQVARFFDYLRTDIHSNGKRGVVMIATNSNMLKGIEKFRRSSGYNTGQLLGRMRNHIVSLHPADDIIEEDVRSLVLRYYKPGKVAVEKLTQLARNPGHIGLLEDTLNEAWTEAQARKVKMTDELVLQTARQVLGQIKKNRGQS